MAESFQKRRNRQRRTRVNIAYDVHTGNAIEKKELPFIMGVIADLAGDGAGDLPDMAERKFVEIGPENFDKVLKAQGAKLTYSVDNKLSEEGGKMGVDLKFESFEDFSPDAVAEQVEPLKELLDRRRKLTDLRGKLASNYKLDKRLQDLIADEDSRTKLKAELDSEGGDDGQS